MEVPVKLIIVDGDPADFDREVPLIGSELVIGRAASSDLSIDHSRVSMQHCRLTRQEERLSVLDLRSTYGTAVNGQNVTSAELKDGDLLKIGPTTFLVAIGEQATPARQQTYAALAALRGRGVLTPAAERGRDPNQDTAAVEAARRIFESLTTKGGKPEPEPPRGGGELVEDGMSALIGGRKRSSFQVRKDDRGIAVIHLLDRSIVQDADIIQINAELDALVAQGLSRIVLDFGNVRHLSSQALGILLSAQKRCKVGGGVLKLCNPNPEVAEIFKIANLRRAIEIYADEEQALDSDWPEVVAKPVEPVKPAAIKPSSSASHAPVPRVQTIVKLVIDVGKSKGKSIPITVPRFLVGRDQRCQLRPASEAVSRVHTRIDQRDGRVYVRDMGTTNGTLIGERLLHGEEVEARDGDRLQIGPLSFTFSIRSMAGGPKPDSLEDAAASWLFEGEPEGPPGDTALMPMPVVQAAVEARRRAAGTIPHIRHQVSGDALIVTILTVELRDEEQIGPVRHELLGLLEQDVPKRLIVKMEQVRFLSSLAVAMLLSHFQRLDRMGGGLRLAGVRDEFLPALEPLADTGVIGMYPTVDAAQKDPWPIV